MHPSVAFDDVARALSSGGSGVHPSEAHGCLCGAFCARREYSFAKLENNWCQLLMCLRYSN